MSNKKLIIQIPCYNEAETIGVTLSALPRKVPGIDTVEWLIIDDGCTDDTVSVAREYGVDHVVSFTQHQGLASAFKAGSRSVCVPTRISSSIPTPTTNTV